MNQEAMKLLLDRLSDGGGMLELPCAQPLLVLPGSDGHKVISLEQFLDKPCASRGTTQLRTQESFLAIVKRFHEEESAIFCDLPSRTFTAVFDFDSGDEPRWRRHRALYKLEASRELEAWAAANGKPRGQEDFATFLEDRIPDFIEPEGAAMLELALSFQAKKAVTFQSAKRPGDGSVHFEYVEDVTGKGRGAGEIAAPDRVRIAIPLFYGEKRQELEVRFRYRIGPQGLTMWFDVYRLQETIDARIEQIRDEIREAADCPVFDGPTPGEAR